MLKIHCKGITQGVGFRPFVCTLGNDLGLRGSVANVGGDGIIYVDLPYTWENLSKNIASQKTSATKTNVAKKNTTKGLVEKNFAKRKFVAKRFVRFFVLDLDFSLVLLPPLHSLHYLHDRDCTDFASKDCASTDFSAFFSAFFASLPTNAKIHSISISYICEEDYQRVLNAHKSSKKSSPKPNTKSNQKPNKDSKPKSSFEILDSIPAVFSLDSSIPQDLATCKECLSDIFCPTSRHYLYHLTSCTNCGGRYSLIKSLPYDRENTAMSKYEMCQKCKQDYADMQSRFFHAQPISCNDCAVPIRLYEGREIIAKDRDIFDKLAVLLDSGEIVCIKGLGGFALICDATNASAIATLREKKNRPTKPFAIMVKNIATAQKIANLNETESSALCEASAPIVLAWQNKQNPLGLALEQIAPNLSTIGILLANTALHHICFSVFGKPIIYTSANLKGEPIITNLQEAQEKLESITSYFLDFEREIYNGIDDSILRFIAGDMRPIRLARGKTPLNFALPNLQNQTPQQKSINLQNLQNPKTCAKQNQADFIKHLKSTDKSEIKILAFGAQDKSTLCFCDEKRFMLSPYIGDLSSVATQEKFITNMEFFALVYDFTPRVLVSDFHPRYDSVKIAKQVSQDNETPTKHLQIYHHHAHLCSILGEVASSVDEEILGIIWDGSGLGEDSSIWGGEFLFGGFGGVRRVGHFGEFFLYGGEVAIKEIWRVGYALSKLCGHEKMVAKYEAEVIAKEILPLLKVAIQKGINTHKTTSVGRLFDGVASLLGILQNTRYEGESGALIEELYYQCPKLDFKPYTFCLQNGAVKLESFIYEICEDIFLGEPLPHIARRFIHTLSIIALDFAKEFLGNQAKSSHKQIKVGFSGGVFQNKALCEEIHALFSRAKIPHFFHTIVPTNDSGISFGQAAFGLYGNH